MKILSFKGFAELGMDDPLSEQWPVDSLEMIASMFCEEAESLPINHHKTKTNTRQAQVNNHVLAERKRREKLTQKFIALSALIPGLKKIDKASVLGDAIKYLKQLQEKVKILEDQTNKRSSALLVRKYQVFSDKGDDSSEIIEQIPQIDARFCGKDVLIAIHCPKTRGILEKTLVQIEKLNLSVVNSCAMSFGDSTLNITISAQKDEDFSMNMEELVKNLRGALEKKIVE